MVTFLLAAILAPQATQIYPVAGGTPRNLIVLDVRMEKRYSELCLAASIQGNFNADRRNGGQKIYLIGDDADATWLTWLEDKKYIEGARLVQSVDDLLKKYGGGQAVISDREPPHLGDIAATVAGCEKLLLAVDEQTVARHHLSVTIDLRHRWKTNIEAYKWLLDRYRSQISRKATSFTVPFQTKTHTPWHLRDYQIANRLFTYWISGTEDGKFKGADAKEEAKYIESVLARQFPSNIPTMGYPWSGDEIGIGEWGGVTTLSRAGKYLIPTDNFANLSVWTSFPPSARRLRPSPALKKVVPSRHYAALVMSDGDNLCTWRNFFPEFWIQADAIGAPVGWTMGPTLGQLAPPIYDWVCDHQPPGSSIGSGVSGIGYVAMEEYGKAVSDPEKTREEFIIQTDQICEKTNENWLWIMRYGGPGSAGTARYNRLTPHIETIMGGYGAATHDLSRPKDGKIFHMFLDGNNAPEMEASLATALKNPAMPRCFGVFLMNWGYRPADVARLVKFGRGQGIEWVTPEQLSKIDRR